MAKSIIEAARAAYTKPKGYYDISPIIQGVASAVSQVVKKRKEISDREAFLAGYSFEDLTPQAKAIAEQKRKNAARNPVMFQQFQNELKQYAKDKDIFNTLTELDLSRVSKATSVYTENYLNSLRSGELAAEVAVTIPGADGDKQTVKMKPLFTVDQDMRIKMLDETGSNYIPIAKAVNRLNNLPKKTDGNKPFTIIADFEGKTFSSQEAFNSAKKEVLTRVNDYIKNGDGKISSENVTKSLLLDKSFSNGSFVDYYINNKLFQDLPESEIKEAFEKASNNTEEKNEIKNQLVLEAIKNDNTFDEDVNSFLNEILDAKKPVIKVSENTGFRNQKTKANFDRIQNITFNATKNNVLGKQNMDLVTGLYVDKDPKDENKLAIFDRNQNKVSTSFSRENKQEILNAITYAGSDYVGKSVNPQEIENYISNINIDAYIPARKLQGFDFLGREINTSNKRNSKALDLIKKYSQ